MFDFLNQNAGALTVIFTVVVALSTVVYAILTGILVSETRRMRQAQTEPRIEVTVRCRDEWISLVNIYVRNIGLGPAYDISFSLSAEGGGDGAQILIEDFTKAQFLKTGLKYLGPGQELKSDLSQMTERFEDKIQSVLVANVVYRGALGKRYEEQFRLDFSEFKGRSQLGKPHLYAIAQSLEKIQHGIGQLATGSKRLKTDVYDREDREKEKKEWEEHRADLIEKSKQQNIS